MQLTTATARSWIERWDRQQERYLPDRETVFAVIADAVVAQTGRPDPLVIDLACGPGSLGARIRDRLPRARVIGVDTDPVLLALAGSAYGFELVDHNLTDPKWIAALPISEPVDAIVSTTALHWLYPDQLARVYAQAASVIRPGGILINGDDMVTVDADIDLLERAIGMSQVDREGVGDREDWAQWWTAIKDEPQLAAALAERDNRAWEHPADGGTGYEQHLNLLREAGFRTVSPIWQYGRRRIVAAVR
ncbi:class I SAM-dependent methyltransferase [Nocardia terpenica]|uniref:Methyltransferase type 11 n=1 Tax=Nocardia terpenica TaxID=455432 RepID=A0A291RTD4_9NOCA|nr:class I SAM-dependent methyltransferase [Nocardia terpenica]ATL70502.1 methyltransferase type 11 [Nocardia terpenica]